MKDVSVSKKYIDVLIDGDAKLRRAGVNLDNPQIRAAVFVFLNDAYKAGLGNGGTLLGNEAHLAANLYATEGIESVKRALDRAHSA